MTIAHISPNQNAYSETFIQNHKKHFEGNVKFYYGGFLPSYLEGEGLLDISKSEKLQYLIRKLLGMSVVGYYDRRALLRSFKKNKIDIVYAEYGLTGVGVMNVCKEMNIPLIVNFHGYEISMTSIIEKYRDRYKRLFDYASYIVVVSKQMERTVLDLGCPEDKIIYTPCPPDDLFLDVRAGYTENSFLSVGRFVDKKAPYYSILAMRKVITKFPDAKLYIAGEGELFDTCANLVRYFNLENNVMLLGRVAHADLLEYYKKVKAFVLHSVIATNGDSEGTPVAVLEASAAGLPVISTYHAGIQDVVVDKETGFLVQEHDVNEMAERMIEVLSMPSLPEKMGYAGRNLVKMKYTTKHHMDIINGAIRSVL